MKRLEHESFLPVPIHYVEQGAGSQLFPDPMGKMLNWPALYLFGISLDHTRQGSRRGVTCFTNRKFILCVTAIGSSGTMLGDVGAHVALGAKTRCLKPR